MKRLALMAIRVLRGLRELLALRAFLAVKAPWVRLHSCSRTTAILAILGHRDLRDHSAQQARPVRLARPERKVRVVLQYFSMRNPANKAIGRRGRKAIRARLAHKA